ncbi:MAG TPA: ABC transporter substrate-binding protein [Polyangiaceae bacterium]|nr:ABC transporter substrate-binding protein [Polyangiaceae bacterium]
MISKFGERIPSRGVCFVCCVVVASAVACGSSDNSDNGSGGSNPNSAGGSPIVGHGGSSAGSSSTLSNGGSAAAAGGAAPSGGSSDGGSATAAAGAANAGAANVGTGGAATGGAASGGTANGGSAHGGAANGGKAGADTGPYPAISLAGLTTAVELAPVRLAANGIYPAKVNISSGGVDALFGSNAPLVATNAETQALRSSVQHTNLRIIFTVCEGLYRIVAKKSAGITTLADLKGKTVDYSSGTSSAYFLHQMLGLVNLTESDVKTGSTPSANSGGQAAAFWEPNMAQYASGISASDRVEFQKDDQGHEVYRELFDLHATAESLADPTKRRTIVGFVRSLITASEQIRNDPTVVYPLMTGPTGVSQAVLVESFKYERYAGTLVPDLLDQLVTEEVWHAKQNNRTARGRADLAKLIDASVLQEAMQ